MQRYEKIIVGLLLAIVMVIPGVIATTTLNVPEAGTNYTTLTVNCTTDLVGALNVSVYYNASGGAADLTDGTKLSTIANTSASQTEFTGSPSIEALTDGTAYNFTCYADNNSVQEFSEAVETVGIDNTAPTYTFDLYRPTSANYKGTQWLTWTSTDATSGVETVATSVTSPNTDTCPTQSWSDASATEQSVALDCTGTYTAAITVTDNAGNTASTEDTFKVYAPGAKDAGSSGGTFSAFSVGGDDSEAKGDLKVFAIVAIIILAIWFLGKK